MSNYSRKEKVMESKEIVTVKCLFCEATITGEQRYMIGGKNLSGTRGRVPIWLRNLPEHTWYFNGMTSNCNIKDSIFYLCPEHQTPEHKKSAFDWAERQNKETESTEV